MPLRLSKHRVLLDGIPLNESQSTSLPSAATLDIWSVTGNIVPISGTATISGFTPAPQAGTRRILLCTGTPSFTHSTNLLLPGSADYTATSGDRIEVLAITTTQFRLSLLQTSVLHFATKSVFPTVGTANVLYRDRATGLLWSWNATSSTYDKPLAALSLDTSGNTVGIVGADGNVSSMYLGSTRIGLSATSAGVANNGIIPFNEIRNSQDYDNTADLANNGILVTNKARFMSISWKINTVATRELALKTAATNGTYRAAQIIYTLSNGGGLMYRMDEYAMRVPVVSAYGSSYVLTNQSGMRECSTGHGTTATVGNLLQVRMQHDITDADPTVTIATSSFFCIDWYS